MFGLWAFFQIQRPEFESQSRPTEDKKLEKVGSGGGSVGRAVRGSNPSMREVLIKNVYLLSTVWKRRKLYKK